VGISIVDTPLYLWSYTYSPKMAR